MNISKDLIISDLHCNDCAHFNECQYYTCDKTKAHNNICKNFAFYLEDARKKISDLPFSYSKGYDDGFRIGLNASVNAIKGKFEYYFKEQKE